MRDRFSCVSDVIVPIFFCFQCSWVCLFYGLISVYVWCYCVHCFRFSLFLGVFILWTDVCAFVVLPVCLHSSSVCSFYGLIFVRVVLLLNDLILFSLSSLFFDVLIVQTDFVHVF